MAITIIDLPKSTQYELLKDKTGRKQRIKDYIDSIDTKWPTKLVLRSRKRQFWEDNQAEYDALKGISPDTTFTQFFNKFNGEQDLIDQIKPEHVKQIGKLLTETATDDELIKQLKATARSKAQEISDFYDNADGGITWGDFLVDLIRDYYLKEVPKYINTKLNENGIKLSELDKAEWEKAKDNLFNNVYSTFTDDKKESDLDPLIKGLNDANSNINDLIVKAKPTPTPTPQPSTDNSEEIKKLNEQIKKLSANQEKHKPEDLLTDYDDLEEDRNNWKTKANNKDDEIKKLQDDNKNLLDAGKLAANKIKALEAENKKLKDDAKLKPTPVPTPGETTSTPIIGGEEWKAVAEYFMETDFVKRKDLLRKLNERGWNHDERTNIQRYLKAIRNGQDWLQGRISPTRFSA